MKKLTVFESPEAIVDVYPEVKLVYLTWRSGAAGSAFRAPVEHLIEATRVHGLEYFLSDTRRMGPILFADTEWTERKALPQLIQAGMRRSAVLTSHDVLTNIAVDNMVASIPREAPYVVQYFAEPEPALQWLYKNAPAGVPDLQAPPIVDPIRRG